MERYITCPPLLTPGFLSLSRRVDVGQLPTGERAGRLHRNQTSTDRPGGAERVQSPVMDKLRVFVCDDSASVRERLVTMALDLPEVDVVGQAEDAPGSVDAIRQAQPDVVILDIRMPGGSGIEVLRRLKRMTPAPAVIMLTNFSYKQYRATCEAAGADFFLDKSTEFDQIPLALELVRQGLRIARGQPPGTLAQVSDTLAPAEAELEQESGQSAGARRRPENQTKLRAAGWLQANRWIWV